MRCPVCGSKIDDEAKLCPVCKTRLVDGDEEFACPMCGALVDAAADVCPSCGAEFADEETTSDSKEDIVPSKTEEGQEPVLSQEKLISSELEDLVKLKGIGLLKAQVLYNAGYTDLRKLKAATVKELAEIKGIGHRSAAQIKAEMMRIDLDGIRSTEVTEDDLEQERQCTLCGTILSAFETSCYECGMIFDKSSTIDAKEADLKALDFYEKKLYENPADTEAWYARGSTLVKLNQLKEALASFDQATEIDAKYDAAWIAKADAYRRMGDPKKAAECYTKVISATGAMGLLPKAGPSPEDQDVSLEELKEFELELTMPINEGEKHVCSTCGSMMPQDATACPVCGAKYSAEEKKAGIPMPTPTDAVTGRPSEPARTDVTTAEVPSRPPEAGTLIPEPAPVISDALREAVAGEPEPVVDVESMDEKSLYRLLSDSATQLKPLLALAKEQSIDITEGKRLISEAVIYGKKKEVKKAVSIMLQGKKTINGAIKLRFLREISTLENDAEELKASGANLTRSWKHLKTAKDLLKAGDFVQIPENLGEARKDIDAFKKVLGP